MDYMELIRIGIPLLAIGGAWGGAKVALNGTRSRVHNLEVKSDDHITRLASIEAKVDILLEKK